jgi:hypothetical protein
MPSFAIRKADRVSCSCWPQRRLGFELRAKPSHESLGPSPLFQLGEPSTTRSRSQSFTAFDTEMEQSAWSLRKKLGLDLRGPMSWNVLGTTQKDLEFGANEDST